MKKRNQATLTDVARLAGVAPMTVSRFLRERALVSEKRGLKIAEAIDKIGYIPDLVARSFRSDRSGIIATVVPSLSVSVFADTLQGITEELHASGRELMVGVSGLSAIREEEIVRAFIGRRPDGIVLTGSQHTATVRAMLSDLHSPVVEIWTLTPNPIDMNVGYSDVRASWEMMRHLVERRYRKIALICGPTTNNERAVRRREGYELAVKDFGLPISMVYETQDTDLSGGRLGISALLERAQSLDAIFCSSDVFAVGALFECQRRGIKVPEDLAIAGFQGLSIAAQTHPAITTVNVPRYEMGRMAAQLIVERLEGGGAPPGATHDLGFEVVRRDST